MRFVIALLLFLTFIYPVESLAFVSPFLLPGLSWVKAKKKKEKHFDLNKDGYLDRYERELYKTQQHFNYPLVKTKKQIPYDFNHNRMFEPVEYRQYLKAKKSKKIKKP